MILKGNQRAGGIQLAKHLLNKIENDHVTVHEVRGFISNDITGAFKEAYAISQGTRCKQFLFSLSLSPPETETVPISTFEDAIKDIEKHIGLEKQPRAIVFHEKEGRRHAHAVWSRIDLESMTAINLPHYKLKLRDISKQLYLENKWRMPLGFADSENRNPLNFSHAEWAQAKRMNTDPREIKKIFQESWAISDTAKSFENAIEEHGYFLAQGDRRSFVAIDVTGEVFSVSRMLGIKKKELQVKLERLDRYPSLDDRRAEIKLRLTKKARLFLNNLQAKHAKNKQGINQKHQAMKALHNKERKKLSEKHSVRWINETKTRSAKLPTGLKALWFRLSGKYQKIRNENETNALSAIKRDKGEMEALVKRQIEARQRFQKELLAVRHRELIEMTKLRRSILRYGLTEVCIEENQISHKLLREELKFKI